MKLRSGFVSNSSSSSFLIYGTEVDASELAEKLNLTEEEKNSLDEEGDWYLSEILYKHNEMVKGLEFISAYGGEAFYLGLSWDSIGDDETGKEFKSKIEESVKTLLGDNVKCKTHQEAWHD
jgi:hypothetical protein